MSQMAASTAIVDTLICFSNLLGIKALRQDQKRFDTLAAENVWQDLEHAGLSKIPVQMEHPSVCEMALMLCTHLC